jgi:hypothetical protein
VAVVALLLGSAACEVEWGGGRIALEDPAPPPDTTVVVEETEERLVPIPDGPLLYLARIDPDGGVRVVPMARLGGETPGAELGSVVIPDSVDDGYRARFDSTFHRSGMELQLHAAGVRMGTVVLSGATEAPASGCPSVATGRALLLPGQTAPRYAFALPAGLVEGEPTPVVPVEPTRRMSVAGPVLAERLINDQRSFLAQRMALTALRIADDTMPVMAATYLIADSLAAGPPTGEAISLFFLARYDAISGYRPIWQEVRRYDAAADKEAFEYLDWLVLPAGRLDVIRRYDGTGVGLATSLLGTDADGENREIGWIEPAECSAIELLGGPEGS